MTYMYPDARGHFGKFLLKGRIDTVTLVGIAQLGERLHECLGNEHAAELPEVPARVGQ